MRWATSAANTSPMATASPWRSSTSGLPASSVAKPGRLEGVGQRVPVVQDQAATSLAFVAGDDLGLAGDAPRHLLGQIELVQILHAEEGVLGHLAVTRPPLTGRAGCASVSVSHTTPTGCQNEPTRFLPSGRLTPVFPPMAAST